MPRELLDNNSRFIPGDGVSPIVPMLRKLAEKGCAPDHFVRKEATFVEGRRLLT